MKKSIILIYAIALLAACAGNKRPGTEEGKQSSIIFLTVKNTLNTSVGISWQGQGSFTKHLGRVKAGRKEKFVIENAFYNDRVRLIARPNFGGSLVAQVPVDVEEGKSIVWELSRNFVTWQAK